MILSSGSSWPRRLLIAILLVLVILPATVLSSSIRSRIDDDTTSGKKLKHDVNQQQQQQQNNLYAHHHHVRGNELGSQVVDETLSSHELYGEYNEKEEDHRRRLKKDDSDVQARVEMNEGVFDVEGLVTIPWNETFDADDGRTLFYASIRGIALERDKKFFVMSELDEDPNQFFKVDFEGKKNRLKMKSVTNLTRSVTTAAGVFLENAGMTAMTALAFQPSTRLLFVAHDQDQITSFDMNSGILEEEGYTDALIAKYGFTFPTGDGFNSMIFDTRDDRFLWIASEVGADVDGHDNEWIRMIKMNVNDKSTLAQFVYKVEPPGTLEVYNGVVGIVNVDQAGNFLVLERSKSTRGKYNARLYFAYCENLLNINDYTGDLSELDDIQNAFSKTLILDFEDDLQDDVFEDLEIGNFESVSLKKVNEDHAIIVCVSNNDFEEGVDTQMLELEIPLSVIGVATPHEETEPIDGAPLNQALRAKTWVNPDDPRESLIFATMGQQGLGVYALDGTLLAFTDTGLVSTVDYFDIDILYGFPMASLRGLRLFDLIVVTDLYTTGRIKIFKIDRSDPTAEPVDVTGTYSTLFVTNPTAVTTYTSPFSSRSYLFVTIADNSGNGGLLQLEMVYNTTTQNINLNTVVRGRRAAIPEIDLPGLATGLVADREFGRIYVSVGGPDGGIYRFEAEPGEVVDKGQFIVAEYDADGLFQEDFRDLDIYYGKEYNGYLIVAHPSDYTFAVFDRRGENNFLGFFAVGVKVLDDSTKIDKVDAADGVAIININLGPEFSCGLFVVSDGNDETPDYSVANDILMNSRTNFKLVDFEAIKRTLPSPLNIDTWTWGPRRFALALQIDLLAQEVYVALYEKDLSGRDAELLLGHLGMASYLLYKPGTMLRRLMSPTGGVGQFSDYDELLQRRRLSGTAATRATTTRTRRRRQAGLTEEDLAAGRFQLHIRNETSNTTTTTTSSELNSLSTHDMNMKNIDESQKGRRKLTITRQDRQLIEIPKCDADDERVNRANDVFEQVEDELDLFMDKVELLLDLDRLGNLTVPTLIGWIENATAVIEALPVDYRIK